MAVIVLLTKRFLLITWEIVEVETFVRRVIFFIVVKRYFCLFKNASIFLRYGTEGCAFLRVTVIVAVVWVKRIVFGNGFFFSNVVINVSLKVFSVVMVSIVCIRNLGTRWFLLFTLVYILRFFKVISIVRIFFLCSICVVFVVFLLFLIRISVSFFVFVSFGVIMFISVSSSLGSSRVGVGLSVTIVLFWWAIFVVVIIFSSGDFSCINNVDALVIRLRCVFISVGERVVLASVWISMIFLFSLLIKISVIFVDSFLITLIGVILMLLVASCWRTFLLMLLLFV